MTKHKELKVPALEIQQGPHRRLYSFAVDGKRLRDFTTVSRVRRDETNAMQGYQRPEVLSHIAEIRNYIESSDPMVPNALVVAFDERVRFEAAPGPRTSEFCRTGTLIIPIQPDEADEVKSGWIVDGQQRAAAIRDAQVSSFPVCVTAFITGDQDAQREQFILVNSTKPLPRSLIYELLPTTHTKLPSLLQKRRFPSRLLNRLNNDADSPFLGRIQTPTNSEGVIKDNSILRMIESSLTDGVLYRYRDPNTGEGDEEKILAVLKAFWGAIAETWPTEWALAPRKSRLTHGAGIASLGAVMDAIADKIRTGDVPTKAQFTEDLKVLVPVCRWTSGYWDFGRGTTMKWNDVQNTGKHIQVLTNHLLVEYRAAARAAAAVR